MGLHHVRSIAAACHDLLARIHESVLFSRKPHAGRIMPFTLYRITEENKSDVIG
jgi:hypothetical protein